MAKYITSASARLSQHACILVAMIINCSDVSAARFIPLGDLPGGDFISYAYRISGDGSTVVGSSHSGPNTGEAFRWTEEAGMVGLGIIPGPFNSGSEAFAANADGEFVVGNPGAGGGGIWQVLGPTTTVIHQFPYEPRDISPDGSIVVGYGWVTNPNPPNSDYAAAFRWTEAQGIVLLDGGVPHSLAYGISGDGQTIVGSVHEGPYQAFRWTEASGLVGLGYIAGGTGLSDAYDVSFDGTRIVGRSKSLLGTGNFTEAFLWTEQDGMVGLGDLDGGDFDSEALGISADGSVVVGGGNSDIGPEAFLWTQSKGMVSVRQLLTNYGIDITGWNLDKAVDVSDDGRVITGYGRNPQGAVESWIFIIPEPSSWSLLLTLVAIASNGRCRRTS